MPGRWSLHSFFDNCQKKRNTHTRFTNDNNTITKTIACGIKNGPCETLPFFTFSSPFPFLFPVSSFTLPLLFLYSSFTLPLLFLLLFLYSSFSSFPFPFLFCFLFRSFSFFSFCFLFSFLFPFPFLFLSLSFSSPFPILSFPFLYYSFSFSLSSLMWILWSRCEASPWKNDKRKKKIMSGKTIWKGSVFLQTVSVSVCIYVVYCNVLYYHVLGMALAADVSGWRLQIPMLCSQH